MTWRFLVGAFLCSILSACGGDGSNSTQGDSGTPSNGVVANSQSVVGSISTAVIELQGSPPNSVSVGSRYSFQPAVSANAGSVSFSVTGLPSWMSFDTATGALTGSPTVSDVGTTPNMTIVAASGAVTSTLGPFAIRVNAASTPAPVAAPIAAPIAASVSAPVLSGTPAGSVVVGNAYKFSPTVTVTGNAPLVFTIANAPSWATFNAGNGELSGIPSAANVGTYSNIVIGVSDGSTNVTLEPFSVSVTQIASGSVTLAWIPPTENSDGTPLTNLAGYRISFGTSPSSLIQTVNVTNPSLSTYVVSNLESGQWFFSVESYTTAGVTSPASDVVSTTL
jgi:Putative Ig domain